MAHLIYVSVLWKCDCGEQIRVLEFVEQEVTEYPPHPTEREALASGWKNPDKGVYVCPECAKEET